MIKDKPYRFKRKNKNSFKRTIRRGDVVSVNGVGSIYSFKDHFSKSGNQDSLMLAGLSHWQQRMQEAIIPSEWRVDEPRLKALLDKDYFVLPPDFRDASDDGKLNRRYLPYYRFPNWHYCPILSCGKMKHLGLTSEGNQKCSSGHKSEKSLVPMRFVVICKKGHIDDFPFFDWAHQKKNPIKDDANKDNCDNRHLVYQAGKGGNNSILSVRINCSNCDASESLATAFIKGEYNPFEKLNRNHNFCSGRRPWLGSESNDKCNNIPEVVLRNAIKVYYPVIKSSIYIPIDTNSERTTYEFLNDVNQWNRILKRIEDKDKLKIYLEGVLDDDKYTHLKFDDIFKGILNKEKNLKELNIETIKNTDEETYRFQEYNYIKDPGTTENSHLELSIKKRSIEEYDNLSKYFSNIFLVNRLTETRVQTGFTRSKPFEEGSDNNMIQELTTDHSIKWLPATVVKGEGIFLEFNLNTIEDWEKKFNFEHLNKIKKNYNDLRKIRGLSEEQNIRNKYYLIHTFSHLLINQLSYSCGYGSSSLRERIYCNASSDENLMQGTLIYTASGDSEGSLGGLVREGEPQNLIKIIKKMVHKANVCSYDPVCLDHKEQGLNGTNASACHACSFLSETSCEQSNQLLDRTTITGYPRHNSIGYFQDLIED